VLLKKKTPSIFALTTDTNHKRGHCFESVKGSGKEGVAALMSKKSKQRLNFSMMFKAVQVLGEQDEAQTPSSGDTQCHPCAGNPTAEQPGWTVEHLPDDV